MKARQQRAQAKGNWRRVHVAVGRPVVETGVDVGPVEVEAVADRLRRHEEP